MHLHKYHGSGNDFLLLPDPEGTWGGWGGVPAALVRALCDRHTGIGADGIIRILYDDEARRLGADLRFDLYNADGSPAEVSGNGVRCVVAFELVRGQGQKEEWRLLTGAGVVVARPAGGRRIAVDMGTASVQRKDVPMTGSGPSLRAAVDVGGQRVVGTGVGIGNPHFVVFVDELGRSLDDGIVDELGPPLETHPAFPKRTNVDFVEVVDPVTLRVRTWERGVGETLACGSGACAAAVAAASRQRAGEHVRILELGGELEVEIAADGHVWLTGEAEEICSVSVAASWLASRLEGGGG